MTDFKEKVKKAFEEQGVPVPQDFDGKKKETKTEAKLVHIGVEHLFMGILKHVEIAEAELQAIIEKNQDERAKKVYEGLSLVAVETEALINTLAESVDSMFTVEELSDVLKKLQKELQSAALLQLTDTDIPKEKMH